MMRLVAALCLLPGMALAQMQVRNLRYLCDRDVVLPVVFVSDPDQSIAVLAVDSGQFLLYAEPAASGLRYGWPSDGSHHVLLTKGAEATLLWRDAATGTETPVLTACVQQ
jgi:membrane-bound inhibitor of C-type lysozyme